MSPLTVFLTTFNAGLQGSKAQEQDLSSWLVPVLHDAANHQFVDGDEEGGGGAPDIYAIAVQELLPLHLALAGLTTPVLVALTRRIQSLLSSHATSLSPSKQKESYTLVSRVSHVGVALWIFAKDSTLSGKLGKPVEARLGLWYLGMGNKGAVGLRLPVKRGDTWEVLTFVSAHLEAHDHNISRRNEQYQNILSSLIFTPSDPLQPRHPIHETSHLFILGDLNYRLARLPKMGKYPLESNQTEDLIELERERIALVEMDTLRREQREGRVFGGLREGDLTRFAPTYKRIVGKVDGYSKKRIPGWTDRILFASYTDPDYLFSPESTLTPHPVPAPSNTTQIRQFSSTPQLTISDHKPVHAVLVLPTPTHTAAVAPQLAPILPPPPSLHGDRPEPKSREVLLAWAILGTLIDRAIGWPWTVIMVLGFGNAGAGIGVGAFITMVWGVWWSGIWSA